MARSIAPAPSVIMRLSSSFLLCLATGACGIPTLPFVGSDGEEIEEVSLEDIAIHVYVEAMSEDDDDALFIVVNFTEPDAPTPTRANLDQIDTYLDTVLDPATGDAVMDYLETRAELAEPGSTAPPENVPTRRLVDGVDVLFRIGADGPEYILEPNDLGDRGVTYLAAMRERPAPHAEFTIRVVDTRTDEPLELARETFSGPSALRIVSPRDGETVELEAPPLLEWSGETSNNPPESVLFGSAAIDGVPPCPIASATPARRENREPLDLATLAASSPPDGAVCGAVVVLTEHESRVPIDFVAGQIDVYTTEHRHIEIAFPTEEEDENDDDDDGG